VKETDLESYHTESEENTKMNLNWSEEKPEEIVKRYCTKPEENTEVNLSWSEEKLKKILKEMEEFNQKLKEIPF